MSFDGIDCLWPEVHININIGFLEYNVSGGDKCPWMYNFKP